MDDNALFVNLHLANGKVQFKAASNLRPETEITFDYVPPLGDGDGFLGLEMLLISFAGCVSTALVALLKRMGHPTAGYRMRAEAIRTESPVTLKKITAEFTLDKPLPSEAADRVIKMATDISPVLLAMKGNVDISLAYRQSLEA